jgi:hypothetical protein
MKRQIVLVGQKNGIEVSGGGCSKSLCLTTEYAHRWNSYGLVHILYYEEQGNHTDRESQPE